MDKKRKLMSLISISLAIAVIAIGIFMMRAAKNDSAAQDIFHVPEDSKVALVLSSGPYEKEKTAICFYDSSGKEIFRETFSSASCRNAIEEGKTGEYNFFTHERIYFNNETIVENEDLKGQYSFASDDGNDEVYGSGFIDSWQMYYKNIAHGLSYKIEELGSFDLLTCFNNQEVHNFRILEASTVAVNSEEGAIYAFSDDKENNNIAFNKIIYDGMKFTEQSGTIDISKAKDKSSVWSIVSAVWGKEKLYVMTSHGEGNQGFNAVYIFEKREDDIVFAGSERLDAKLIGVKKKYTLQPDTVSILSDGKIKFYSDYAEGNYPGIITYDVDRNKFAFKQYAPGKEKTENVYRKIRDSAYLLEWTEDNNAKMTVLYSYLWLL